MHNHRGVFTLTLFLLVLIVLPFVSSVPPVTTISQFAEGYTLEVYPIKQYFVAGEDVNFHVHVFNTTNGMPINESLHCFFHLYHQNGSHLATLYNDAPDDLHDYEFLVLGGNFTKATRSYHAYCYDGGIGGDYAYAIEVNDSGFFQTASIYIIIFIFFSSLLIGMVILRTMFDYKRYYEKTYENYMSRNMVKSFFSGVVYYLFDNAFALYYLLGFGVMVTIVQIVYTFNVVALQTTFEYLMYLYSFGIVLVGVTLLGRLQEFIANIIKDAGSEKWGIK